MRTATAIVISGLASVVILAGVTAVRAQTAQACFFQEQGFQGRGYCLEIGDEVPRLPPGWDDAIASIDMDRRVEVEVCDQPRYGGRCTIIDRSVRRLRGGGDRISSFRVRRGRPRPIPMVCFFGRRDFRGRQFCAEPGDVNQRLPAGWDDRISSIQVQGPVTVDVCSAPGLRGRCRTIDRDLRQIGPRLDDNISSYKVARADDGRPDRPERGRDDDRDGDRDGSRRQAGPPLPHGVCFYEGIFYQGESLCLRSGEVLDRLPPRWRGKVASVKIFGRGVAHVCEEPRLGGLCHTVNKSDNHVGPIFNSWLGSVRIYH